MLEVTGLGKHTFDDIFLVFRYITNLRSCILFLHSSLTFYPQYTLSKSVTVACLVWLFLGVHCELSAHEREERACQEICTALTTVCLQTLNKHFIECIIALFCYFKTQKLFHLFYAAKKAELGVE